MAHVVTIADRPVVPGDVNGDGRADIIWQHRTSDGLLSAWFMNGSAMTGNVALTPSSVADTNWHVVGSGDFNQDGFADLYWQNQATGELSAWGMGGATGTELQPGQGLPITPTVTDLNWKVKTVADLNRDGHPDLIWQHATQGDLAVWYMNGLTLPAGGAELLSPAQMPNLSWQIVGARDQNGDGYPDLYWHNISTGEVSVWRMVDRTWQSSVSLSPNGIDPAAGWVMRGVGDLDGNGTPDVIWQNTSASSAYHRYVSAWLMAQHATPDLSGLTVLAGELLTPISQLPDVFWTVVVPK